VAERTLAAAGEDAPYTGTAASTGSPLASERWAFASGPDPDDEAGRIVVANPGDAPVDVELVAFGDGEDTPVAVGEDADGNDLFGFTLAPGERREVVVTGLDDDQRSVEVRAGGPVVAERRVFFSQADEVGQGTSTALGIPLRQGLELLD
jgi:hypothetical protein